MTTYIWVGDGSGTGNFSDPNLWNPEVVSAFDESDILSVTNGDVVTVDQPAIEVDQLIVDGGSIVNDGNQLFLDSFLAIGGSNGAASFLLLSGGGEIDAGTVAVSEGGTIIGSGSIVADFMTPAGNFSGNVTLQNGGVIEARVDGTTNSSVLSIRTNVITNAPGGIFRADLGATLAIGYSAPLDADHVFTNLQDLGNGTSALVDGAYVPDGGLSPSQALMPSVIRLGQYRRSPPSFT
jgi:hypothetical protein